MRLKVEVLWNQVRDVEIVCEKIGTTEGGEKIYRSCEMRLGGVGPIEMDVTILESEMIGVTRIP